MSIRDKFIKLAKSGGSRKEFVKLANKEGLTDKTKPRKKLPNSKKTKAFAKASSMNLSGREKTNVFKNLSRMKKFAGPAAIITSVMKSKPANADEVNMKAEDFKKLRKNNMRTGGLVLKGKPRKATKGWK